MIKDIKARWHAEETKIGMFLKNWIGKLLGLCAAVGFALENFTSIPTDFIPEWLKTTIAICAAIGFVAGKMTKK
jgi:hypothetical protein